MEMPLILLQARVHNGPCTHGLRQPAQRVNQTLGGLLGRLLSQAVHSCRPRALQPRACTQIRRGILSRNLCTRMASHEEKKNEKEKDKDENVSISRRRTTLLRVNGPWACRYGVEQAWHSVIWQSNTPLQTRRNSVCCRSQRQRQRTDWMSALDPTRRMFKVTGRRNCQVMGRKKEANQRDADERSFPTKHLKDVSWIVLT